MKIDEMFKPKYLKGKRIYNSHPSTVTIKSVGKEMVYTPGIGKGACWVLHVEETDTGIVLGRSDASTSRLTL